MTDPGKHLSLADLQAMEDAGLFRKGAVASIAHGPDGCLPFYCAMCGARIDNAAFAAVVEPGSPIARAVCVGCAPPANPAAPAMLP